jgi:hypothetical protein
MNWNRLYGLKSYLRSSLWVVPFIAIPFELIATVIALAGRLARMAVPGLRGARRASAARSHRYRNSFLCGLYIRILVIFLIRTAAPVWRSRAHPALIATSLGALAVAVALALSPAGRVLGFAPLPWPVIAAITGLVIFYLAAAEHLKRFAVGEAERHRHRRRRGLDRHHAL